LISKHVFDRLSAKVQNRLKESESHGLQADGSRIAFYGVLEVTGRLRDQRMEESFVISKIKEDAILGMPFLVAHRCAIEFQKPALVVDGISILCTDRHGRQLASSIQVVRDTSIPPGTEILITCRVTSKSYSPQGVVEGTDSRLLVAASISRPGKKGQVQIRCLNPMECPIDLQSGIVIGSYTGVEEDDIQAEDEVQVAGADNSSRRYSVPDHLVSLYQQAATNCASNDERGQMANLLRKYGRVFSTGDDDIGLTDLVSIQSQ
jgi:hypothetical protein